MQGIIDRIEEGTAIIQLKTGGEILCPLGCLPKGSAEGSVVEIVIKLDERAAGERKAAIRKRQSRLKPG